MSRIFLIVLCLFSTLNKADELTTANANWPPWRVIHEDGTLDGIEIEILQHVANDLGLNLVTKGCGWKRCLKHMEIGGSDVMTGVYKTPERQKYMTFIEPAYYTTQGICFYTLKSKTLRINQYEDLKPLTIGTVKKVSYFDRFDNDTSLNKFESTTGNASFRLLEGGRIDVIVLNCINGDISANVGDRADLITRAKYIFKTHRPVYLAISNKSPLLPRQDEFSQSLQKMLDNHEIDRILASYGIVSID